MDETTLKIAAAGLLHDIGKLVDEEVIPISEEYFRGNADLYMPYYDGHHTHRHALRTAAFVEYNREILPEEFNAPQWGQGDSFVNLAAGHHKPQTPLQWIIATADRISSGWDRATFEDYSKAVPWKDYRKTRLVPIFEYLLKDEKPLVAEDFCFVYPLKPADSKAIFPCLKENGEPRDEEQARAEYKVLLESLLRELQGLAHRAENIALWLEHFDSLLMRYATSVPAARAGRVMPDVSLYDHMRTTAALAVALYCYHRDQGSLVPEAIRDDQEKKFLLITGDFFGVQKFIFGESGEAKRYRSKILRGRSFAVSLFSELASDRLCRVLELPSISVVLEAAGKFTLISPNLAGCRAKMHQVENEINDWLVKIAFGEAAMGFVGTEAAPEDFVSGGFLDLWDRMSGELDWRKRQKLNMNEFGGAFSDYLDQFRNDLHHPLCPFCGKRPSHAKVEGSAAVAGVGSSCLICRDHIFLGENLVKKRQLAVVTPDTSIQDRRNALKAPIFEHYQLTFTTRYMGELAKTGQLLKLWNLQPMANGTSAAGITNKYINGYVPVYAKEDLYDPRIIDGAGEGADRETLLGQIEARAPKTFEHIARMALQLTPEGQVLLGTEALAALKADVDHLGMIMACGLPRGHYTLSRLATLSRQLNWYFTMYLPSLLAEDARYRNVYTVFAGGDDLFLIGPWPRMIELVGRLRTTFADYVSRNPEIHFSAGIILAKPHTPLGRLAEQTEIGLEKAKHSGRNSITVFSETVKWELFEALQEIKAELRRWLQEGVVSRGVVYRLNEFVAMAEKEARLRSRSRIHVRDMECLKWRALFSYMVERNVATEFKEEEERRKMMNDFSRVANWLDDHGGRLRIALWDVLYNLRRGG